MALKHVVVIIFLMLAMGMGLLSVFLPAKVIRLRAFWQLSFFRKIGLTPERIDRLPFFTDFYGEPYSKRLRREWEDPQTVKGLVSSTRMWGGVVAVLFFLGLLLYIVALQAIY